MTNTRSLVFNVPAPEGASRQYRYTVKVHKDDCMTAAYETRERRNATEWFPWRAVVYCWPSTIQDGLVQLLDYWAFNATCVEDRPNRAPLHIFSKILRTLQKEATL